MDFTKIKKLTIGDVELKQLFINGIQVWKSGYKNWVKYSTEADGVTIYNGGLGYKNGYRIRSGGAEGAISTASCTGFIPVKGGDIIRVGGTDATFIGGATAQAVNASDSSFTNLGQVVGNTAPGYGIFNDDGVCAAYGRDSVIQNDNFWQWTVPPDASGIAHIRVTGYTKDGSKLIVTINEEIE